MHEQLESGNFREQNINVYLNDAAENPPIIGHEFSGEIVEVGAKWKDKFQVGQKYSIQPAIYYEDGPVGVLSAPGYSYKYIGGDATYVIIPKDVLEQDCLLPFEHPGFYPGSLAEPLSCVIGAMHANYHTNRVRTFTKWRLLKVVKWQFLLALVHLDWLQLIMW